MAEQTESAAPLVPAIRRLVQAELADPTGARSRGAEVPAATGDLVNDDAARDELRQAARGLLGGSTSSGSLGRQGQGSD